MSSIQHPRPEVLWFASLMEKKLQVHDDRDGWKDCGLSWLLDRVKQETRELEREIILRSQHSTCGNAWVDIEENIRNEAADIANFCMMIADNTVHGRMGRVL